MIPQATASARAVHMTTLANYEADPASGAVKVLCRSCRHRLLLQGARRMPRSRSPRTCSCVTLQAAVADPGTTPAMYPSDIQLSQGVQPGLRSGPAGGAARQSRPAGEDRRRRSCRVRRDRGALALRTTSARRTGYISTTSRTGAPRTWTGRRPTNTVRPATTRLRQATGWGASRTGPASGSTAPVHGYQLTFPAGEIPQAKRFWSLTAYLPVSIPLVPNRGG